MVWIKEKTRQLIQIQPIPVHDFFDLIYIFIAGGLLGTVYEELLILILHSVLEDRSGSILTPFNYVYGLGAVAILLVMYRLKRPFSILVLGAVMGGVVEYGLSLFQEYILGSRSWDYSARPLNIHGRTTIPYMLIWGMLCYFAMRFMFPALLRIIHRIPKTVREKLAIVLFLVILCDACISLLAIVRYSQRANGVFFDNGLMNLIDSIFSDAFMKQHFPNMVLY